jgi:hypothetical protein
VRLWKTLQPGAAFDVNRHDIGTLTALTRLTLMLQPFESILHFWFPVIMKDIFLTTAITGNKPYILRSHQANLSFARPRHTFKPMIL